MANNLEIYLGPKFEKIAMLGSLVSCQLKTHPSAPTTACTSTEGAQEWQTPVKDEEECVH